MRGVMHVARPTVAETIMRVCSMLGVQLYQMYCIVNCLNVIIACVIVAVLMLLSWALKRSSKMELRMKKIVIMAELIFGGGLI